MGDARRHLSGDDQLLRAMECSQTLILGLLPVGGHEQIAGISGACHQRRDVGALPGPARLVVAEQEQAPEMGRAENRQTQPGMSRGKCLLLLRTEILKDAGIVRDGERFGVDLQPLDQPAFSGEDRPGIEGRGIDFMKAHFLATRELSEPFGHRRSKRARIAVPGNRGLELVEHCAVQRPP